MKTINKICALVLGAAMAVSVFGCSNDKKQSDSGRSDDDGSAVIESDDNTEKTEKSEPAEEEFTGFKDDTIKAMAETYGAGDMTIDPVMASELGASEYNYVEGFMAFSDEDPDFMIGFLKFKTYSDAVDFINEVWFPDCDGYLFHESYGTFYDFAAIGFYEGGVSPDGSMQITYCTKDTLGENSVSPEDFEDKQIAELCREYQENGFSAEKESIYDGFKATGVGEDNRIIQVCCIKFDSKESAIDYVKKMGAGELDLTLEDMSDGSVSVKIDGNPEYYRIVPIEGTISADGLLKLQNYL